MKALSEQCKNLIFSRLKDGSSQTDDPLVMKTFVYVKDPQTFCACLQWKHDENDGRWEEFFSMTPAVD